MTDIERTVSLIGMPGAGKSTVGVLLAKQLGLGFSDTDLHIQAREERTLQDILETEGYLRLRKIEEEVVMSVSLAGQVIATGGSVVYSDNAMQRLRGAGRIVYLKAGLETLRERVARNPERGIASDSALSFEDIYAERTPKYERYADITVSAEQGSADSVALSIKRFILEQ
ncbi:MAG: shikimate kinase [Pseudomonadota bacterium]